jgi:hypothetical protein
VIKAEVAAKLYITKRNSHAHETDHEVQPKDRLHPADSVRITDQKMGTLYRFSQTAARAIKGLQLE